VRTENARPRAVRRRHGATERARRGHRRALTQTPRTEATRRTRRTTRRPIPERGHRPEALTHQAREHRAEQVHEGKAGVNSSVRRGDLVPPDEIRHRGDRGHLKRVAEQTRESGSRRNSRPMRGPLSSHTIGTAAQTTIRTRVAQIISRRRSTDRRSRPEHAREDVPDPRRRGEQTHGRDGVRGLQYEQRRGDHRERVAENRNALAGARRRRIRCCEANVIRWMPAAGRRRTRQLRVSRHPRRIVTDCRARAQLDQVSMRGRARQRGRRSAARAAREGHAPSSRSDGIARPNRASGGLAAIWSDERIFGAVQHQRRGGYTPQLLGAIARGQDRCETVARRRVGRTRGRTIQPLENGSARDRSGVTSNR